MHDIFDGRQGRRGFFHKIDVEVFDNFAGLVEQDLFAFAGLRQPVRTVAREFKIVIRGSGTRLLPEKSVGEDALIRQDQDPAAMVSKAVVTRGEYARSWPTEVALDPRVGGQFGQYLKRRIAHNVEETRANRHDVIQVA
ncbi:MAG TPA: hypothetical protein VGY66_04530 [Gemmataceae bacterium]|nr:hypothetical protein [Gemmataceae bacterium]